MNLLIVSALVLLFAGSLSVWACLATRFASGGKAGPKVDDVFYFAIASGFIVAPVMLRGLERGDMVMASIGLFLGILLGIAATVDRLTTWAPDGLMIPICVLATLYGPIGDAIGPIWSIPVGLVVFGVCQLLWVAQYRLGYLMIPPPDIIALVVPFLLFGVSVLTLTILISMAIVLLLILRVKSMRFLAGDHDALDDGQKDTGIDAKNSVAFLGTAFPVTILFWGIANLEMFSPWFSH